MLSVWGKTGSHIIYYILVSSVISRCSFNECCHCRQWSCSKHVFQWSPLDMMMFHMATGDILLSVAYYLPDIQETSLGVLLSLCDRYTRRQWFVATRNTCSENGMEVGVSQNTKSWNLIISFIFFISPYYLSLIRTRRTLKILIACVALPVCFSVHYVWFSELELIL